MNPTKAATLRAARMLVTMPPGPRQRMCTNAAATIAALATSVCTENVSGSYGMGTTNRAVLLAAPGKNRSR